MRIVFLGTAAFGIPTLKALINSDHDVVGVVTATDKYGGRNRKRLIRSPVKRVAQDHGIRVLQPSNLKATEFLKELASLRADLQVVVAFRMLPEVVFEMPPLGTINLHASLLPKYRGAAPIQWALINGEKTTGLTTFFIKKEIDTGNILLQKEIPISREDTAGTLHDKMMKIGSELVMKTVEGIENGSIEPKEQDHSLATPAPKIYRETSEIDFTKPTEEVYNFIRGMSPWPGAYTTMQGKQLKITRASMKIEDHKLRAGKWISDGSEVLKFATSDGFIRAEEVQLEGKKRMEIQDFLNGFQWERSPN